MSITLTQHLRRELMVFIERKVGRAVHFQKPGYAQVLAERVDDCIADFLADFSECEVCAMDVHENSIHHIHGTNSDDWTTICARCHEDKQNPRRR